MEFKGFNHPEISKCGLELDFQSWRDFNREIAIRVVMDNSDLTREETSETIEHLRASGMLDFNYKLVDKNLI